MALWRPRKPARALAAEAATPVPGVPGWAGGSDSRELPPGADPYCGSSPLIVAESARGPRRSVSDDLLGGRLQSPLQRDFDPRSYPSGNPLERRERVARPVVPEVPMTPAMMALAWEAGREAEEDWWDPGYVFP